MTDVSVKDSEMADVIGATKEGAATLDKTSESSDSKDYKATKPDKATNGKKGKGRRPSLSAKMPAAKKQRQSTSTRLDDKITAKLARIRAEVKVEFETTKGETMAAYPQHLKDMFGEIGFTRWSGGKVYACIILNPYNVAPSEVRREFYKLFNKLHSQSRLDDLPYLIYFYGEQNLNAVHSFIAKNKFTPFEQGKDKKDHFLALLASRKKLEGNKKLTKADEYNLRVLQEMEEDLAKVKQYRRLTDFPEEYDLLSLTDLLEEAESESDEDHDDSVPKSPIRTADKVKPSKKSAVNKSRQPSASAIQAENDQLPSTKAANLVDDTLDFEATDEDEANLKYAFGESDHDEGSESDAGWQGKEALAKRDDDDMNITKDSGGEKRHVGKKKKTRDKPKGQSEELKREQRRERKKDLAPEVAEKREFKRCEKLYRPFIREWEIAIINQDLPALKKCFDRASTIVEHCSAPFLEAYFADLVKRTKSFVRDSAADGKDALLASIKGIGKKLRELHNEKKAKVPLGFKPPKVKPFDDMVSPGILVKSASADVTYGHAAETGLALHASGPNDLSKIADEGATCMSLSPARPSADAVFSATSLALSSAPYDHDLTRPPVTVKSDRKAFSLGKLKTRVEPQPEGSAEQALVFRHSHAAWMTNVTASAPLEDSDRSLALTFLKDMATHFPPEKVNIEAVASSIEKAIHEWAEKVGPALNESQQTDDGTEAGILAEAPNPPSGREQLIDIYWNRVHAIIGAICGANGTGTGSLLSSIMNGDYPTVEDIVSLSEEQLKKSFDGIALNDENLRKDFG